MYVRGCLQGSENGRVVTIDENKCRHFTDSKSCQIIESILKYKNGFKNNLMYKEIFN
jgi:hypothetical protein